jgi:hypothetical protein
LHGIRIRRRKEAPMRETIKDAGMLRDEARFVLAFGALMLALGLAVALGHSVAALIADPIPRALRGALLGGPFILMGWAACRYAAWRLEQAIALETQKPARKPLRVRARGAVFLRRLKLFLPLLAAELARRQQNLKLYLVGERR